MKKNMSRRSFVLRGLGLPVAGSAMLTLAACGGEQTGSGDLVCVDMDALTSAEKSVRRSLNYTESSPNLERSCSGCDFFSPGPGGCGSCTLFSGGAVNPDGRCDSWSADA